MTQATRIFINGPVLTLDRYGQTVEALALSGDRILAIGSKRYVTASFQGSTTEVIDLGGRALLPGFIDGHGHFLETGRSFTFKVDLRSPPTGKIRNLAELKTAVSQRAAVTPPGEWIEGFGYDDTLLAEKRHPLAADLDAAAPDHPVAISHISGHFLAVNSLALNRANLVADTPDPKGGCLRRLADGTLSGLLEEPSAENLVRRFIPPLSEVDELRAAHAASAVWAAKGVTTAQDGWTTERNLKTLLSAFQENSSQLTVRVQILPELGLTQSGKLPIRSGETLGPDQRLVVGPTKLFADGSLQGYTGHLSNPYHRVMYDLGPTWRGYPMTDPDSLAEQISFLHLAGRQVSVHANGDQAIEAVINAFEAALRSRPMSDHRHFIIHCQTVREDQLDRMARLGIKASFFAAHIHYWGDRHQDVFLGPDRAARLNPLASAASRGLVFSLHNDSPITPIDPLLLIQTAVTRATLGGQILGPEYRLSTLSALRAVTADAAYLAFEDRRKGELAPGLLADLVILDANPLETPPGKIADIRILATLVGGKLVYGEL
jgi:predicted amidohydrolase YtcJ